MAKLNTNFTGNASGIVSASKQAKDAVKDFAKTSENALSSLGDVFGVNTGKIEQMTSAAKGFGLKLSQSANDGVAAFGKLLGSVNAVQLGIAGLGLGAAVASFKALTAEAEAFKNTVAGANMEMQTAAYIDTYRQALHDMNADTGRSMLSWQNTIKETIAQAKGIVGQFQMNSMNSVSGAIFGVADVSAWKTIINQNKEANALGEKAKRLAGDIYELELKRSRAGREWATMEAEANNLKNQSLDKSKSQEERAAALLRAEQLLRQIYTEKYDIESAVADKMDAMNALTESTPAQIDAANQQRAKANSLLAEMEQRLSRILSKEQNLGGATKTTTKNLPKEVDNYIQRVASGIQKDTGSWSSAVSGGLELPKFAVAQNTVGLVIKPEVDEVAMTQVGDIISEALDSVANSSGEAIGELVGNLINGEKAWKSFGNSAASALADLAISVGKTAIATGVATLGIKKALESLNGAAAIAAGAALVALGTAVKTSLSNAANGNYSASSSVASGSYSSSSTSSSASYDREIKVQVTGTLQAKGSTLQAVLNNENRRQLATT